MSQELVQAISRYDYQPTVYTESRYLTSTDTTTPLAVTLAVFPNLPGQAIKLLRCGYEGVFTLPTNSFTLTLTEFTTDSAAPGSYTYTKTLASPVTAKNTLSFDLSGFVFPKDTNAIIVLSLATPATHVGTFTGVGFVSYLSV